MFGIIFGDNNEYGTAVEEQRHRKTEGIAEELPKHYSEF
jgi:hypothetical protein